MGQFEIRRIKKPNIALRENNAYHSPECLIIWGDKICGNITGILYVGRSVEPGPLPELSPLPSALLAGLLPGDLQDGRLQ